MEKSLVDLAIEILGEKQVVSFQTLWKDVVKKANLTEEDAKKKIASFYSQLTLDGRVIVLENSKFSLRDNIKSEKIKNNASEVYNEMELETSQDDDEEESEEKKEENTNAEEESAM